MAIIQDAITGQTPTPGQTQQDPTGLALQAAQSQNPLAATPATASPASPAPATTSVPPTSTVPAPPPGTVAQLSQPATWNVTPDQTVEGRIASIINSGSPIIQSARTHALETANGRGLLNSSMAVQAGEAAAQQSALPIAQADAATAAKAASYNADQPNQFGIKNLDAQSQYGLQQLQTDNAKLLQTNNQAATAFNQALVAITNINQNDKMDGNAKTQAIAQIQAQLQNQLKTLGATSGLNLNSQLNFAGYDGFDANGNFVGFGGTGPTASPSASGTGTSAPIVSDGSVQGNWAAAYGNRTGSGSGSSGGVSDPLAGGIA